MSSPEENYPDDPRFHQLSNQSWSNATWGWIAGIAAVVLILVIAFGTKP